MQVRAGNRNRGQAAMSRKRMKKSPAFDVETGLLSFLCICHTGYDAGMQSLFFKHFLLYVIRNVFFITEVVFDQLDYGS